MKEVLKLKDVSKEYGVKGFKSKVLNNISLSVNEGDFISIMGPSGAGKTTLLNLISTLDKPTKGQILLDNIDIAKVKNKDLSKYFGSVNFPQDGLSIQKEIRNEWN